MRILGLVVFVMGCSSTSVPGSVMDSSVEGAAPGMDAAVDTAIADALAEDAPAVDPDDHVMYNGTEVLKKQVGCAIGWKPTNVAMPIKVDGVDYALTIIGDLCPPDSGLLDPLSGSTGFNFTTNIRIWSIRFRTPAAPKGLQMQFYVYGGDSSAEPGQRTSVGRLPGQFTNGPNTIDHCDFGEAAGFYATVVDQYDPQKTQCQLLAKKIYYFNTVVPIIDVRGNTSAIGWIN